MLPRRVRKLRKGWNGGDGRVGRRWVIKSFGSAEWGVFGGRFSISTDTEEELFDFCFLFILPWWASTFKIPVGWRLVPITFLKYIYIMQIYGNVLENEQVSVTLYVLYSLYCLSKVKMALRNLITPCALLNTTLNKSRNPTATTPHPSISKHKK